MKKLESIFEVFVVALFSLAISVLGIGSFVKYQGNIGDIIFSVIFSAVAIALWIVTFTIMVDCFKSFKTSDK